jgi:glycosyltransferase involved in cell wall biosynthesis
VLAQKPAVARGTYINFLLLVDKPSNTPSNFQDDQFNPILVPVAEGIAGINAELGQVGAQFIITVGLRKHFRFMEALPSQTRHIWFHVARPSELTIQAVELFFWKAIRHSSKGGTSVEPLMSVFTPAYKSREKILIPYESLKNQTYQNWEWIIYDDSPTDHNETWELLAKLRDKDYRIILLRSDRNDGFIGSVKRKACMQARGAILVELDHDDHLLPDCLQLLNEAYQTYPEAGFFYGDWTEVFEGTNRSVSYGDSWAFWQGGHYKILMTETYLDQINATWLVGGRAAPLNQKTLRHIVGIPNHIRAWSREAYLAVGGHNSNLPVVDDYELTLRVLFKYQGVHIKHMTYVQYRQEDGSTFTFKRNALIQRLVKIVSHSYDQAIHEMLLSRGQPDIGFPSQEDTTPFYIDWRPHPPLLSLPYYHPNATSLPDQPLITVIIPTFNRSAELLRAIKSVYNQDYQNWELAIVGDGCPVLDQFMETHKEVFVKGLHMVRWWNLGKGGGPTGHAARNYAAKQLVASNWIAYLDDDNEWTSDHLSSLVQVVGEDPKVKYVLASVQMNEHVLLCNEPRLYRVDTSGIMHRVELLQKYGYWRAQAEVGYATDWDLVSRWKGEPWAATLRPTVIYHGANDAYVESLLAQEVSKEWLM